MKNLRLAIRSLLHFRLYTVVNLLGLALCLACVIVIARYVHDEFSVDRFNREIDRIYAVTEEAAAEPGSLRFTGIRDDYYGRRVTSPSAMLAKHAGVEARTDFIHLNHEEVTVGQKNLDANIVVTDTSFFSILDYPLLRGTLDLSQPESAIVTDEFARKAFGGEDALGQVIRYHDMPPFTVTGVLAPLKTKSSIGFDIALPKSTVVRKMEFTLIRLHPHQDYEEINRQNEYFYRDTYYANGDSLRNQLYPLKKVYFSSAEGIRPGYYLTGEKNYTLVLLIVGILILGAGVINYVNIQTAVFLRRGREFGMKKVFGASAKSIFLQLWVENAMMVGAAMILALSLTELLNPVVRNLLGFDQLPFGRFELLFSTGLFLTLPLLVGLFSLIRYKRSTPIDSLRSIGKTGGRSRSRYVILGLQYAITVIMISLSLLFLKQLNAMLDADLGFRSEDVIQVQFQRYRSTGEDMDAFREWWDESDQIHSMITERLNESPLFSAWAYGASPVKSGLFTREYTVGEETRNMHYLAVTPQWLTIYDLQFLEGEVFEERPNQLLLTESAKASFGIEDFREETVLYGRNRYQATGVIRDIRTGHVAKKTEPLILGSSINTAFYHPISLAVVPGMRQQAVEFLSRIHAEFGEGEFTCSFVEDDIKALYAEDRKVATIYSIFTVIAILISALGLFSISLFDVQQRFREIAIRKVNGATTGDVLGLLLKRYLWLLLIAFAVAVPVSWFLIRRYLEEYAYQTRVSWWIFAAALLVTAAVSLLTLIWQTRKAARTNPATVIRNE